MKRGNDPRAVTSRRPDERGQGAVYAIVAIIVIVAVAAVAWFVLKGSGDPVAEFNTGAARLTGNKFRKEPGEKMTDKDLKRIDEMIGECAKLREIGKRLPLAAEELATLDEVFEQMSDMTKDMRSLVANAVKSGGKPNPMEMMGLMVKYMPKKQEIESSPRFKKLLERMKEIGIKDPEALLK